MRFAILSCAVCVLLVQPADTCTTLAADESVQVAGEPLQPEFEGRSVAQWHQMIARIDPKAEQAPATLQMLQRIMLADSLPQVVRRDAALTLGRIGLPAKDAVPLLAKLLESSDLETKIWAARSLALYRKVAAPASPQLVQMLMDADIDQLYRQIPLEALGMIGATHPDVIPALASLLRELAAHGDDYTSQFKANVIEAVGLVGPDAESLVPLMVRMQRSRSQQEAENVRLKLAEVPGRLKSSGAFAIHALTEALLTDKSAAVQDAAAISLGQIGDVAMPMLTKLAEHSAAEIRWRVARSLGEPETSDSLANPLLAKLLQDGSQLVRIAAAESSQLRIEKNSQSLDVTIDLLRSDERQICMRAQRLLVQAQSRLTQSHRERLRRLATEPTLSRAQRRVVTELLEKLENN
ncbi:MAG: HEAT repeat domain-containing protein [Pirellulaceae bacterium]